MRIKGISAAALAALALSGLFAAGAHAAQAASGAEKEEVVMCLETRADAAFMAAHPQDPESQREAWDQIKPNACVTVSVSLDEIYAINPCLLREQASHQDQIGAGRAIIEKCLAELPTNAVKGANPNAAKKKKKKARHAKHAHRRTSAQVALAEKR
jgi:hypothetical protein